MKPKQIIWRYIIIILVTVIGYSSYQLLIVRNNYAQEAEMHSRLLQYRPTLQTPTLQTSDPSALYTGPEINQDIVDLQAVYPDVVGWLTIPGTHIDYPFVQGNNNDDYLHMDLDQNRSQAGTIFMDYRNSKDFSDFNTIIFGHNMRNGSMFGTLQNFNDQDFFDAHKEGTIFLASQTYTIEIMAFVVVNPDNEMIYNRDINTEMDKIDCIDYIKSVARYYRDIGVATNDRLVTLSTCNYEFEDARMVIIGRIVALNVSTKSR